MISLSAQLRALVLTASMIGSSAAFSNAGPTGPADPTTAAAQPVAGNSAVAGLSERLRRIDDAIESMRQQAQVPGLSLAVIFRGEVLHARGFGTVGRNHPDEVTAQTLFQACSLSKPLVAMALMRLVQQGRIELDAPANDYLARWQIPGNRFTADQAITVRHLLTHTSGLTAGMHTGYPRASALPRDIVTILEARPPTSSKPVVPSIPVGTWRYSNGAFVVAQLLLEDVTGEALAAYMKRSVLLPLGMKHSTYESPFPQALHDRAARGHDAAGRELPGGWREHRAQAVAGLWSTPTDLARVLIAMQEMVAGATDSILQPRFARQMLTPLDLAPGPQFTEVPVFQPRQGITWLLEGIDPQTGQSTRFWAWGDNTGYKALQVALINGGHGAVVMTNSESGVEVTRPAVELIASEFGWPLPGNGG